MKDEVTIARGWVGMGGAVREGWQGYVVGRVLGGS